MTSTVQLLIRVLPLAIAGALSPTLFGLMTVILSNRHHAIRRGLAFALGAAVPVVLVTFAIITVFDDVQLPLFRRGPGTLSLEIDIFVGSILVVLGLALILWQGQFGTSRASSRVQSSSRRTSPDSSIFRTFWFGFGMMAINGTTLLMLIPAAKDIAVAQARPVSKLTVAIIIDTIIMLSVLVPLAIYTFKPKESAELMEQAEAWIRAHVRPVLGSVALLIGSYLIAKNLI